MSTQDRVLNALVPEVQAAIQDFWEGDYGRRCESEIERLFAATAFVGQQVRGPSVQIYPSRANGVGDALFIEPQYVIGDYRADFLMGFCDTAHDLLRCIVVECDGHAFHERTKEQAARDKARDRYLSSQVGRVLRFTGSELFRDPNACLVEAIKVVAIVNGQKL